MLLAACNQNFVTLNVARALMAALCCVIFPRNIVKDVIYSWGKSRIIAPSNDSIILQLLLMWCMSKKKKKNI